MTMSDLQKAMLKELNDIDFDYYKSEFGYSEWQTILKTKLSVYSGWCKDKIGIDYSPSGVKLHCHGEVKTIRVNDLKKLFENQNRDKQLALF